MAFSIDDIPDQIGKNIIITGASSGLGLWVSRALAMKGGHVIMACRNLEKAQPLADAINADAGSCGGKATVLRLDTTDLDSIDDFARDLDVPRIDSLLLNAGIMAVKYREIATRSAKYPKMESQMACNVVGHFYLVHALMPQLRASPGVRIVTVSSIAADQTKATDSLNYPVFRGEAAGAYNAERAYSESKLGALFLAHELARRCRAAGVDASVAPSHPGYTRTPLQDKSESFMMKLLVGLTAWWCTMKVEEGALILAVAATLPKGTVPENPYFGPDGFLGLSGKPTATAKMCRHGRDDEQTRRMWEMCEELCGVKTEI